MQMTVGLDITPDFYFSDEKGEIKPTDYFYSETSNHLKPKKPLKFANVQPLEVDIQFREVVTNRRKTPEKKGISSSESDGKNILVKGFNRVLYSEA